MFGQPLNQFPLSRRRFLAATAAALAATSFGGASRPKRLLLRSSWQTVNIGDIAHTPGMLTLLEQHLPDVEVTLCPNSVDNGVEELLLARFPKLKIAKTRDQQEKALKTCDFFLHGSGPGLVGWRELAQWQKTGKPYGIGGITLSDEALRRYRAILEGADFIFCRDTDSLKALKATGIRVPLMEFGPDATFMLDLRDEERADAVLREHKLEPRKFICAVPRLRWTPYWEIHPERKYAPGQIEERTAVNEKYQEADHAKQREAIIAWVRATGGRVLLCPEMTYAVERLEPLLRDKLPDEVKPHVSSLGRYWLTGEAASVYARAFAVVSQEMHSPIIAVAAGTPAIHLRQPTDTRKGQMWRDVGLEPWLFEIETTTGEQIANRLLEMHAHPDETWQRLAKAQRYVQQGGRRMMQAVGEAMG